MQTPKVINRTLIAARIIPLRGNQWMRGRPRLWRYFIWVMWSGLSMHCMKRSTWCTDRFDRFDVLESSTVSLISMCTICISLHLKKYYYHIWGSICQACLSLTKTEQRINIKQAIAVHLQGISLYSPHFNVNYVIFRRSTPHFFEHGISQYLYLPW